MEEKTDSLTTKEPLDSLGARVFGMMAKNGRNSPSSGSVKKTRTKPSDNSSSSSSTLKAVKKTSIQSTDSPISLSSVSSSSSSSSGASSSTLAQSSSSSSDSTNSAGTTHATNGLDDTTHVAAQVPLPEEPKTSDQVVKLISKTDRTSFTLARDYVQSSKLIHKAWENDADESEFTLDLDEGQLTDVVKYLERHKGTVPSKSLPKPFLPPNFHDHCEDKWDADFITEVRCEKYRLWGLTIAANYMEIPPLLELTCCAIAMDVKGNYLKNIYEYFDMPLPADFKETKIDDDDEEEDKKESVSESSSSTANGDKPDVNKDETGEEKNDELPETESTSAGGSGDGEDHDMSDPDETTPRKKKDEEPPKKKRQKKTPRKKQG